MELTRREIALGGAMAFAATSSGMAAESSKDLNSLWTEQGDVKVVGGKMHWASVGTGEPVVLMPKLGGWIADWRHVAAILSKKYRVIVIDNPGHGGSVMNGPPPYWVSVPESAAMLMATLDELGINQCILGGNSLGGCISSVAAALWPQKFSKLILLSVALGNALSRAEMEAQDPRSAASFDRDGRPLPRTIADVVKQFGITDQNMVDEMNASRAAAGLWIRPSERGVGHAGIVDYLPRITASTFLMYGEKGGYKQFEAPGLAKIPKVRSFHVPKASSFTHQDEPQATAQAILEFLST